MSDRQPVTIQKGERTIIKTWYKWKALATVALGTFMGTMDVSIVNISFPILTRELNTDLTTVMWVTLAYILVSTSLMLFVGKTGDQVGRKKIYAAGMLIFTLGLVSCSLAHSITQLIVFRIFQALGAAMAISCGTAIVTEVFPPEERGQGLGLVGVSVSAGFILGPIIGGFLLEWFHWRSIFYTRVPVAFLTFIMALILLEKDHVKDGKIELDLLGTVTSSVGLASIIFGVSQINRFGLTSPLILLLIGLGILSLIAFIFVENRASDPIVDLKKKKNLRFSSATGALFLTFLAYPAFTLVIPFFLIQGVGLMPAKAGFVMASVSMTAIIIGPISGWLSDRFGPVWFSTLGAMCSSVAFSLMRGFDLQTQIIGIVLILSTFGFGIGLFQAPNNSIIMGSVKKENLGTASALMATLRSVGIAVGTAVAGTVYSVRKIIHAAALSQQGVEAGYANKQAVSLAFHDVLIASIIFMALVVVLSLGTRIRENA